MFSFQRKSRPKDPPDVRLRKTIKFMDKDLKANRSGVMTQEQRRRIQRGQVWGAVFWWFMALFFGLPPVVMATRQDWQGEPGVWLVGLFSLFFVAIAFWQQNQTKKILIENQVNSVSGFLSRRVDMVYTGKVFVPVHKITVDDKTFTVEQKVYDSFDEGEHYTLYYVAGTERLLSAELTHDLEKEKRLAEPEVAVDVDMFSTGEAESQSLSR